VRFPDVFAVPLQRAFSAFCNGIAALRRRSLDVHRLPVTP
jgi:hypothetical protein